MHIPDVCDFTITKHCHALHCLQVKFLPTLKPIPTTATDCFAKKLRNLVALICDLLTVKSRFALPILWPTISSSVKVLESYLELRQLQTDTSVADTMQALHPQLVTVELRCH